jgi:hypothetical protein
MKKYIRIVQILCFLMCISCSKENVINKKDTVSKSGMQNFFETFEKDLLNSTRVIAEQDLVNNLTHLQKMGWGGSKYYPLEREALTKMLKELSSYTYAECILFNKSGTIIYSMVDDTLLSRHAGSFSRDLGQIYNNSKEGKSFILETIEFPITSGNKVLFLSMPVMKKNVMQGVLVAGIHAEMLPQYTSIHKTVVNNERVIMFDTEKEKILTSCQTCPSISENNDLYTLFTYLNIVWFIYNK